MDSLEVLRSAMREAIYSTPQALVLEEHHVEAWINRVIEIDPDRALWHCARLSGFGGSEVGPLVNSMNEESNAFTSAHQIVAGKLCILPPFKGDVHTQRGTKLEDLIQIAFERKLADLGISFQRLDAIQKYQIEDVDNPLYEWMRSSLDGLYEVTWPDGRVEIWLVDFKAPSPEMIEKYKDDLGKIQAATAIKPELDFELPRKLVRELCEHYRTPAFNDYVHQLHHYKTDSQLKDVHIDRMVIAAFDYMCGDVVLFGIEQDPQVVSDIVEASEHYWSSYVLQGEMPPKEGKPIFAATSIAPDLSSKIQKLVKYKAAIKELTSSWEVMRDEILDAFSEHTIDPSVILHHAGVDLRTKMVVDEDRALERLVELGVEEREIDSLRKPAKYDTTKLSKNWQTIEEVFGDLMNGIQSKNKKMTQEAFARMEQLIQKLPQKEKSGFDEKKLEKKLLSCGEDPNCFLTERLNLGETRRKSPELQLLRDRAKEVTASIQELLNEDEPTNEDQPLVHLKR